MPKVSVIIPCRNESKYIEQCLESILQNDFDHSNMEVLVVDGMSEDRTREIVKEYIEKYSIIHLFDNPLKITPVALNIGIKNSNGEIIIRADAHAEYPLDYISKLIFYLEKLDADNVGGQWITLPSRDSLIANAVAVGMTSMFGVGNAWFRIDSRKIREVDTVPYGCFRRILFDRIGLFDERLVRNQDDEFNARIKKNGGKIFLIPDVKIKYFARGTLHELWKLFFQYGLYKPLVNRIIGFPITLRQFVPFFFVLFLIFLCILSLIIPAMWILLTLYIIVYIAVNISLSTLIAILRGKLKLLLWLPIVFLVIHFSYGTGYLAGIGKVLWFR